MLTEEDQLKRQMREGDSPYDEKWAQVAQEVWRELEMKDRYWYTVLERVYDWLTFQSMFHVTAKVALEQLDPILESMSEEQTQHFNRAMLMIELRMKQWLYGKERSKGFKKDKQFVPWKPLRNWVIPKDPNEPGYPV